MQHQFHSPLEQLLIKVNNEGYFDEKDILRSLQLGELTACICISEDALFNDHSQSRVRDKIYLPHSISLPQKLQLDHYANIEKSKIDKLIDISGKISYRYKVGSIYIFPLTKEIFKHINESKNKKSFSIRDIEINNHLILPSLLDGFHPVRTGESISEESQEQNFSNPIHLNIQRFSWVDENYSHFHFEPITLELTFNQIYSDISFHDNKSMILQLHFTDGSVNNFINDTIPKFYSKISTTGNSRVTKQLATYRYWLMLNNLTHYKKNEPKPKLIELWNKLRDIDPDNFREPPNKNYSQIKALSREIRNYHNVNNEKG